MSSVLVLLRRELGETFRSPLAYVFLVLFLVLSQLFFVLDVFESGRADLGPFWRTLPWSIVVFAALVSMRAWAEERQQNTYEMLLTFPLGEWQLVLAKFGASLAVLCVGLAATIALPILLFAVGSPDPGAIVSGYLGAVLLASTWCAAGVFLSGLTRSQLLAALVTLVLGLASLVVGIPGIAERLDARTAGLGGLLASAIGGWDHYAAFGRGVVELADVLFFVGWTAVFLHLNALSLALRRSPDARRVRLVATVLVLGCGLLGGRLLSGTSLARLDLTADRQFTLSDATVRIVERAESPILATLYVTPAEAMPPGYEQLEADVLARVTELAAVTDGRVQPRVVYLDAARAVVGDDPEAELTREARLAERGVRPFVVRSVDETGTSTRAIYCTLGLTLGAKDEVHVAELRPDGLDDLEYRIASAVAGLVRRRPPRIALHVGPDHERTGDTEPRPSPYRGVADWLRAEGFDVVPTGLRDGSRLPEDYDALVLLGPKHLSERAAWEIDRALVRGRPVLLAVQRYSWHMAAVQGGTRPVEHHAPSGLETWMERRGVRVTGDRLFSADSVPLTYPTDDPTLRARGGVQTGYPFHVRVTGESLSDASPVTRGVGGLLHVWGTTLEIDEREVLSSALQLETLVESPEASWVVPADRPVTRSDFGAAGKAQQAFPLAALVRGRFAPTLSAEERPSWPHDAIAAARGVPPAPDPAVERPQIGDGALLVFSSARLFGDGLLPVLDHATLFRNALDVLTLDDDLLEVRARRATNRTFPRPAPGVALFWTLFPLLGMPGLVVACGVAVGVRRRRRRATWDREHDR